MWWRILLALIAVLALAWAGLFFYVQIETPSPLETLARGAGPRALVLHHPNPIDPFLTHVARSFTDGLIQAGWSVDGTNLHKGLEFDPAHYDLIVLGTNTFNWSPDWPTTSFLARSKALAGKPVVGIVTGFGSTARAERLFREALEKSGARVLDVRPFWEMRPNDKTQMERPNREVAHEMAARWAAEIASSFPPH
jgi:hypothetical protein